MPQWGKYSFFIARASKDSSPDMAIVPFPKELIMIERAIAVSTPRKIAVQNVLLGLVPLRGGTSQ